MLQARRITVGKANIHYVETSRNGPALVLLHGGSGRSESLAPIVDYLADDFHLIVPDLRGHGRSGHSDDYRLSAFADDINGVIAHATDDGQALLFGHSFGGRVALETAARYGTRVRALAIGDTPLTQKSMQDHLDETRQRLLTWRDLALLDDEAAITKQLHEMLIVWEDQQTPKRAIEVFGAESPWFPHMSRTLKQHDPAFLAALINSFDVTFSDYDTRHLFPKIDHPVLLIQGDPAQGGLMTDADVALALDGLTNAQHHRLNGIGHALYTDDDKSSLAALRAFFLRV